MKRIDNDFFEWCNNLDSTSNMLISSLLNYDVNLLTKKKKKDEEKEKHR